MALDEIGSFTPEGLQFRHVPLEGLNYPHTVPIQAKQAQYLVIKLDDRSSQYPLGLFLSGSRRFSPRCTPSDFKARLATLVPLRCTPSTTMTRFFIPLTLGNASTLSPILNHILHTDSPENKLGYPTCDRKGNKDPLTRKQKGPHLVKESIVHAHSGRPISFLLEVKRGNSLTCPILV